MSACQKENSLIIMEEAAASVSHRQLLNDTEPNSNLNEITQTYDGRTELHAAVISNNEETVRSLLMNKNRDSTTIAFDHERDEKGWVPLHYAADLGYSDLINLLLRHDRSTAYIKDNEGKTAFHIAAERGFDNIMEIILSYNPDCSELVDNNGRNALHHAVKANKYSAVKFILKNSLLSNLYNERDLAGISPFQYCPSTLDHNSLAALMVHPKVDKMVNHKMEQITPYVERKRLDGGKQEKPEDEKEETGSLLVVATLIAMVTFAAGFTLPGGSIQDGPDQGSPILKKNASFIVFIITDSIALFASSAAAFIHILLGQEENKNKKVFDRASRLAFILTVGAMIAMVVAFSTALYAVLGSSALGISVLVFLYAFFLSFAIVKIFTIKKLRGIFLYSGPSSGSVLGHCPVPLSFALWWQRMRLFRDVQSSVVDHYIIRGAAEKEASRDYEIDQEYESRI